MNNIDKFNEFVGLLFADLYKSFPTPFNINASTYLEEIISEDDEQGAFDYTQFVIHSCRWLNSSGYIQLDGSEYIGGSADYHIVLTEKGLETMKLTPDSLESHESIGELLVDSAKNNAIESAGELAAKALSFGFNILTT